MKEGRTEDSLVDDWRIQAQAEQQGSSAASMPKSKQQENMMWREVCGYCHLWGGMGSAHWI